MTAVKKRPTPAMAHRIAQAVGAFELREEGHLPKSVTVVMYERTLVITLEEALTSIELSLLTSPAGAAQVQEFHEQLFFRSPLPLWEEIQRITGVAEEDSPARRQPDCGVKVFPNGTVIHTYLLDHPVPLSAWRGQAGEGSIARFIVEQGEAENVRSGRVAVRK